MYDLKQVIEANTVDGVIDYEKVMEVLIVNMLILSLQEKPIRVNYYLKQ